MPAVIAFIVDIWTFFRVILLTNTLIIDETFWHIFRVKNLFYWCNFFYFNFKPEYFYL